MRRDGVDYILVYEKAGPKVFELQAMVELFSLPQIVSARTPEATQRASALFGHLTQQTVVLAPEEAELAKEHRGRKAGKDQQDRQTVVRRPSLHLPKLNVIGADHRPEQEENGNAEHAQRCAFVVGCKLDGEVSCESRGIDRKSTRLNSSH